VKGRGLLIKDQTGFRRNRSTIDQIIRLQDQIRIHHKEHALGIFDAALKSMFKMESEADYAVIKFFSDGKYSMCCGTRNVYTMDTKEGEERCCCVRRLQTGQ